MNSVNKLLIVCYSILTVLMINLALYACSKEDVDQMIKSISQPLIIAPIKTTTTIHTNLGLLVLKAVWKQPAGKHFSI